MVVAIVPPRLPSPLFPPVCRSMSFPLSPLVLMLAAAAVVGCARTGEPGVEKAVRIGASTDETTRRDGAGTKSAEAGATADHPLAITWEDLDIPLPADSTYQSWMLTSRAKAVVDRYVRITGHMYAGLAQKDAIRTFPLVRDKDCPFGPGGHAHHVIEVNLQGRLRASYTGEPVTVEGFLSVAPFTGTDGKTWSVYHLEGTQIQ